MRSSVRRRRRHHRLLVGAAVVVVVVVVGVHQGSGKGAWGASPPVGSSAATVAPTLYVTSGSSGQVRGRLTEINTATDAVRARIILQPDLPLAVAVIPAQGSPAGAARPAVYVLGAGNDDGNLPGTATPIRVATNRPGPALSAGSNPVNLVVSPIGATAYVVNGFDAATETASEAGTVTPIDITTGMTEAAIAVGSNPQSVTFAPDGSMAYVVCSDPDNGVPTFITPITVSTDTPGTAIGVAATAVVAAPDSQTVYALSDLSVVPIDTSTDQVETPILLGGVVPTAMVISPDGRTAYVLGTPDPGLETGSGNEATVSPIDLATGRVGPAIGVGPPGKGTLWDLVIAPNGKSLYVLKETSGRVQSTVIAINTVNDVAGAAVKVGLNAAGMALAPNGSKLFVLDSGTDYEGPPSTSVGRNKEAAVVPVTISTVGTGLTLKAAAAIGVGLFGTGLAIGP